MTIGTVVIAMMLSLLGYLGVGSASAQQAPSHDLFVKIFDLGFSKHFFWTGRFAEDDPNNPGQSVQGDAAARAGQAGGYTLETRLAEQGVTMPSFDQRDPASVAIWEDASRTFASKAQGVVRVVMGAQLRPGNVWETIEFPVLIGNPYVERIVKIDAATGLETEIFKREL